MEEIHGTVYPEWVDDLTPDADDDPIFRGLFLSRPLRTVMNPQALQARASL